MDSKQLVVDHALHKVEDTPAGEQQTEVPPPRRCQFAPLPGANQEDGGRRDEDPRRHMEEAVDQRVGLQPGDGVHRLAAVVPGEHVVPLQDLVEDDTVDETAKSEAQDEGG
jgi:hypothetical protein